MKWSRKITPNSGPGTFARHGKTSGRIRFALIEKFLWKRLAKKQHDVFFNLLVLCSLGNDDEPIQRILSFNNLLH